MSATVITPHRLTSSGVTAVAEAVTNAVDGNVVRNVPGLVLLLHNTDSGSHDVVFTTPAEVGGLAVADVTVTLAAGATKYLANFDVRAFGENVAFLSSNALVKYVAYQAS